MLVLNEDQRMLMDSARGAIAAKAPIATRLELRAEASPDGFSRAFWRECAEMGWTGVLVPQEFGGIDFGVTGAGLIAREMARTLAPSPFLSTAVLAASALRRSELAAAKAKWLPRIVSGEAIVAFAIDEGPRPTDQTQAMAVKSDEDWLVTADKHFVLDGHVADAFLVELRRFAGTPALFLVEADESGLTRDARTLVDNRRVASVALERVQLPPDAALGGVSIDRGDPRRRPRGRCRGAVRRRRGGVRADDELPQGAQAIRSQNRQFPGAAASCGEGAYRYREFMVGDAEGSAGTWTPTPPARRSTSRGPRPRRAGRRARRPRNACKCTAASA